MRDVGIVMPVYQQRSSHLIRAIRSIQKQSYKKFKFVIVLDGSPESICKLVRKYAASDDRIQVVAMSNNRGMASALNRGFELLKRRKHVQFLTWVSSDNVYSKDFIRILRQEFIENPQVGLAYSSYQHVTARGHSVYDNAYRREFRRWQRQPKDALLDVCFIGPSFLYRKELALAAGDYRLDPVEDYDYWLRLTEHCDIKYVGRELLKYRVDSPHSMSRNRVSSTEQHRKWRHASQLAKLEARMRRGIPIETTVVVPAHTFHEQAMERLEGLCDQLYSNFRILLVDTSEDGTVAPQFCAVGDPRIAAKNAPGADVVSAFRVGLGHVDSPFVMPFFVDQEVPTYDLNVLVSLLRQQSPSVVSAHYATAEAVEFACGVEPRSAWLYRTNVLRGAV